MTPNSFNSPYVGLRPFVEKDTKFFFGRDREIRVIATNIQSESLTVLYGASGVGKSSLLQAGVIAELKKQETESEPIYVREWSDPEKLLILLEQMTSLANVSQKDQQTGRAKAARRFLLLDQFEEYLLYHREDSEMGKAIDGALARLVNRDDVDSNVLIGLRDDSLSELDLRFSLRIPGLLNNTLQVWHLSESSAREAITKPLEKLTEENDEQYTIEPELIEEILKAAKRTTPGKAASETESRETDAAQSPWTNDIEAVYLQLILNRLWREEFQPATHGDLRNPPWTLHTSTLQAVGGAGKIVETHVNDVMKGLKSRWRQDIAARLFAILITPSGRKIAQTTKDLLSAGKAPEEETKAVLNHLSSGNETRIVRRLQASDMYELFHDVLASPVLEWLNQLHRKRLMWRWARYSVVAVAMIGISVLGWLLYRHLQEAAKIAVAARISLERAKQTQEEAKRTRAELAAAAAEGDLASEHSLRQKLEMQLAAAQQSQTAATALQSRDQPQSFADLADQQVSLRHRVDELQAELNTTQIENALLKKQLAPSSPTSVVNPQDGASSATSQEARTSNSDNRDNSPNQAKESKDGEKRKTTKAPVSAAVPMDAPCAPVIPSFEIYERTIKQLPDSLDHVFVYASDMYRTNKLSVVYVLAYDSDNSKFEEAKEAVNSKSPQPSWATFGKFANTTSSTTSLPYVKSGKLQFVLNGEHFRLNVIKRNDRIGPGLESITISFCKQ